jgi:hypothetical protein
LLEHTVSGRGHLKNDFIGFQIDEILVATHRFARLFVPRDERRVRD